MRTTLASLGSIVGALWCIVALSVATSSAFAPKQKTLSSPTARAISMLAPSAVPTINPPFMTNFMFPVPRAIPAVLMCCDTSEAGMMSSARETLKLGMKTTWSTPRTARRC